MIPRETKDIINIKESLFDSNDKIITIAGLSKNAGKTSFLNYLIKSYQSPYQLAITTTGHDGEDTDFLTGLKKPKIKLKAGNYFTTIASVIKNHPGSVRLIKKLSVSVLSQAIFLAQTVENIETEIFGALHMEDQIKLCHEIQAENIPYIIIDGSLDRKSVALSPEVNQIVLVASPVVGNIEQLSKQLTQLYCLSRIPCSDIHIADDNCFSYQINQKMLKTEIHSFFKNETELLAILKYHPDIIYIPGAITDHVMNRFKNIFNEFQGTLIIKHPLHLMCNPFHLELLLKKNIKSLHPFPLNAFILNSYSVDNNHLHSDILLNSIQTLFQNIPVIDIQNLFFNSIS